MLSSQKGVHANVILSVICDHVGASSILGVSFDHVGPSSISYMSLAVYMLSPFWVTDVAMSYFPPPPKTQPVKSTWC